MADFFLAAHNQENELRYDAKGRYDTLQPFFHEVTLDWPVVGLDGFYPTRKFKILKMKLPLKLLLGAKKGYFKILQGLLYLTAIISCQR